MGNTSADIRLSNPVKPVLQPLNVQAQVDTAVWMLCIPEHLAQRLDLQHEAERELTTAEGRRKKVPYVGPVRVAFEGRACFVGALVLGDQVVLGAIPMADMDLVIDADRREVTVNPDNPNLPNSRVKATVIQAPSDVDMLQTPNCVFTVHSCDRNTGLFHQGSVAPGPG